MEIFEYPYVILTILALCFIVLTAVGIYFAIRGAKTANCSEEKSFVNISRMESVFYKYGKTREERCIIYSKVLLDDFGEHPELGKEWVKNAPFMDSFSLDAYGVPED